MAATAASMEYVQKMFLAYFGRPVAPTGQEYYATLVDEGNIAALQDDFWNSAESQNKFAGLTTEAKVKAIFQQLFARDPAMEGLTYWTTKINSGEVSLPVAALTILNGAAEADLEVFNAKLAVAEAFTAALDTAEKVVAYQASLDAAVSLLAAVTDAEEAEGVIENIDEAVAEVIGSGGGANPGQTFTLTTGADNIAGTAGNDTIVGVADGVTSTTVGAGQPVTQTFGGLDVIDGGAGTDTLRLTNEVGTMTLATSVTVKNVENLELVSATNAITADVQAWAGLQSVVVDQKDATATTTIDTKANATSVSIKGGNGATIRDNGTGTGTGKDTLASVTVEKVAGAVNVGTNATAATAIDSLTTLNVIDNANNVTVTAAAGTRVLNLGLNKVTAGTITDAEATGLKIAATGANSSGITLSAAKATTIDFSGDKTVSLDIGNAAAQAANLVITSTNSAGVTLANNALDTDVTFTGAAGKDSVIVGATTKTIDMGAGDDTVEVTGALGTNGKLVGGEGTDTLKMTAAVADTLDNNDTFAKAVEGFEKLSLGAVAAEAANTVNLANLDNISYVISAGTAGGGSAEKAVVTFADLTLGQSITVNGVTVKAVAAAGALAADIAAAFAAGTANASLEITGTVGAGWTRAAVDGEATKVEFTSTGSGDVTDLLPTTAGVAAATAPTVNKLSDGNGTNTSEVVQIFLNDMIAGQSVSVDGCILTTTVALTGTEVATAFATNTAPAGAAFSGVYAQTWTAGSQVANSFLLTGPGAGTPGFDNLNDVVVAGNGVTAPVQATVAAVATTDGVAGASLTLTNMANAGTFEQTGVVAGAATVTMKDATGAADSLNIKLNGAVNLVNTGTLTVAGVETINIEATDSSADTTTLTNPAAASKPNLVAADATKIVVTGNHGVDFTGSTLTKVVELDASGVVATGATTGATAAQIGTAGAVTFSSVVSDKNVIVKTGNGADVISVASITDATKGATITTGAGDDTITGSAGKDTIDAGAGRDTINASAEADTITLGAGNDVYVLGAATNSTLAKSDVITDFVANTKGQGTTAALIQKGATTTVADLTGDTIDVTAALALAGAASTGITVFVASNAADAQTFLQNTGNAGTLTGFALDSTTGKLYMDFDSNGTVDSVLTLTGVTTITEAAFVTGY